MKKSLLLVILFSLVSSLAVAEEHSFTVATYNVDGLPAQILWVEVNTDGPGEEGTTKIAQKLNEANWDIVGLNEDFDNHQCLVDGLSDKYNFSTWRGKVDPAEAIGSLEFRVNSDGLGLVSKKDITVADEKWTEWCSYYGYFDCDNDGMARKGFRHYNVTMPWGMPMSVYILHADAGDVAGDVAVREKQFTQLLDTIKAEVSNYPKVVMGDYNCIYSFDQLKSYFIDKLNATENLTAIDAMIEKCNDGIYPECVGSYDESLFANSETFDHIVYINDARSDWKLQANSFTLVENFTYEDGTTQLSDHHPVYAEMTAIKSITAIRDVDSNKSVNGNIRKYMKNGQMVIERNGITYSVNGVRID